MQQQFYHKNEFKSNLPDFENWLDSRPVTDDDLDDMYQEYLETHHQELPKRVGNTVFVVPGTGVGGYRFYMVTAGVYKIPPRGYVSIFNSDAELQVTYPYNEVLS